jgi:hypothetical protein
MVVFSARNASLSEKEIQVLYQNHPYLIEKRFFGQKVIAQYHLPSGFADIVVFLDKEIVVVELKVVPLALTHLLQLNEYMEDFSKKTEKNGSINGILVGYPPKSDLTFSISHLSYPVNVLILEQDVPTDVKICGECRKAVNRTSPKCTWCSCENSL